MYLHTAALLVVTAPFGGILIVNHDSLFFRFRFGEFGGGGNVYYDQAL